MDIQEILNELLLVIIIPLLGILTKYIVSFLQVKVDDLKSQKEIKDNAILQKYVDEIEEVIVKSIKTTNSTFVDNLKKNGTWSKENFETAFNMTKDSVMKLLTDEKKELIKSMYEDIDTYLKATIEAYIADK